MRHNYESESDRVPLGFGNLSALPGNHIAHFYETPEEWKSLLVSYHKAGLEAGDKCVYLMRPERRKGWEEAMKAAGVDVDGALSSGQLVLVEDKDDAKDRQEALADVMTEIGEKYSLLRSGGDVNLTETHWEWEAHINTVQSPRAVFLCQYDITAFRGDVVMDALRTHPVCIVSNAIVQNPLCESPDVSHERLHQRAPKEMPSQN